MSEILVPVSFGELLDKIAILQIKSERMTDAGKLENVRKELDALTTTWMAHPAAQQHLVELRAAAGRMRGARMQADEGGSCAKACSGARQSVTYAARLHPERWQSG